jgi:hypothetical protein
MSGPCAAVHPKHTVPVTKEARPLRSQATAREGVGVRQSVEDAPVMRGQLPLVGQDMEGERGWQVEVNVVLGVGAVFPGNRRVETTPGAITSGRPAKVVTAGV